MTVTNSFFSRRIRSLAAVFFFLIIALNAAVIDFEDDEDVESSVREDERQELWAKSKSTSNDAQLFAASLTQISS